MRIVWASAAFVGGVAAAIVWSLAPGHQVPNPTFWLLATSVSIIATGLVLTRKRAAIALLILVFLMGAWRGAEAIEVLADESSDVQGSALTNRLDDVRSNVAGTLNRVLGKRDDGLAAALLTGSRESIPNEVTSNFRNAGLAHLLAISGLHVSLVGGIAMAASTQLVGRHRRWYVLAPLVVVFVYAGLAGFAPPVTRAAIMFLVVMIGRLSGRGSHTVAALALAASLMVAIDPEILASLSFQLSFAAMLGIATVAPMLDATTEVFGTRRPTDRSGLLTKLRQFVIGSLVTSIAASVATIPLVAVHFDSVPIWGPIATLVAVPAIPVFVMLSVGVVIVGSLPFDAVASAIAYPTSLVAGYLTSIAELFASLPPRPIDTGSWSTYSAFVYYGLGALLIVFAPRLFERMKPALGSLVEPIVQGAGRNTTSPLVAAVSLLTVGAVFWGMTLMQTDSKDYVSTKFLQLTRGEATLIETPSGNRVLIDGGRDADEVADLLQSTLPFNDRTIDVVMLTHSDADHVGGLPRVLQGFEVATVIHSGVASSSETFQEWSDAIEAHPNTVVAWAGMTLTLDEDVYLEVISTGCPSTVVSCTNVNDTSIVSKLIHRDISMLLTGDIERGTETRLVGHPSLRSTVLKVPHHGSTTSSTQSFISAVDPALAVIAVGTENPYGHPHPEVLGRIIEAVGAERVLRNDQGETIDLRTDGDRLWIAR